MSQSKSLKDSVFQNHYKFYSSIGADTVKSAAGHINQVSADYQGRVLYELLQNAFDRAKKNIIVKVIGTSLFIANDGRKFTYNSNHDYKNGGVEGKKFERRDFQSLCSISTSNKTAIESIGNKGVGFKSVYALGRFANIHTKGIINPDLEKQESNISFSLYDVFDDVNNLPELKDYNLKESIVKTIKSVQREFPKRGVPGYYFPIELIEGDDTVFNEFDDDIVTIIEVPFSSKEDVENLIEEIKGVHFGFVGLKYENTFKISFESEQNSFTKKNFINNQSLFSTELNSEEIKQLALDAGVDYKDAKVAIKLKKEPKGLFYNYLPTKKDSPFKYVDFHADFHTTVDRKDISFDGGKVGKYNKALLDACIELYFSVLKSYAANNQKNILNTKYINNLNFKLTKFNWKYLELNNVFEIYDKTRDIFKVEDYIDQNSVGNNKHYLVLVNLLSNIAKKYFDVYRKEKKHQLFFTNILSFINSFTNDHNTRYSRANEFKQELFNEIKRITANVIPKINFEKTDELFYKKRNENEVKLPESISIKITDFEINDSFVRSILNIKEYKQPNEILKYFKQCSFDGNFSSKTITEEEQKTILKSCYNLFLLKSENQYLISHRYTTVFTNFQRDRYSTSNQANINVSTLFLKLITGKYKPAQLCFKAELDLEFLTFTDLSDRDNWLRYLGVSTDKKIRIVDGNIYKKLKNGLENIPQLITNKHDKDRVSSELLKNLHILNTGNALTHPAVINDNNYSFLKSFIIGKLRPEFDNLKIKNYSDFPLEFRNILKDRLIENLDISKKSIIQFYQNIFKIFADDNWYLIIQNDKLKWVKNTDFFILNNKSDFDLCIKNFSSEPILAYYFGNIYGSLKNKIITSNKGDIIYSSKELISEFKIKIAEKLPFILINLSHSKNTEVNYLSEETELLSLQKKFVNLSIYQCNSLEQELNFGELGKDISLKSYAYENDKLFLSKNASKSQIAQGICDFIFSNTSIKDQVELILFHKELSELRNEVDASELDIIHRKWKLDYQEKFIDFQNKILSYYNKKLENNLSWYKYNKENRNEFLIELDKTGKLHFLEKIIFQSKKEFEGYFDLFQLEINYNHINEDIAKITMYYNLSQLNKNLRKRLGDLIKKGENKVLGLENEIEQLKIDFPDIFEIKGIEKEVKTKQEQLSNIQDIEEIYKKIKIGNEKNTLEKTLDTSDQVKIEIPVNHKQIIFQGNSIKSNESLKLEITGASGEVEVLICLIKEFTLLKTDKRKKGIIAIKNELKTHTKNNSFDSYADECLKVNSCVEKLTKALIPLFFVSRKYKYANFDLITFKNEKPLLIEVKTTTNINSKSFYISMAEVNTARNNKNYEIVRVTPNSIIFMGNPIIKIDQKIMEIKTNGFKLKPRNYELIMN